MIQLSDGQSCHYCSSSSIKTTQNTSKCLFKGVVEQTVYLQTTNNVAIKGNVQKAAKGNVAETKLNHF